jgi:hypothetical protein
MMMLSRPGQRRRLRSRSTSALYLAILGPLVLAANLLLLLGGEVVGDVERLADLLGGLALDHVGDGLAAHVEKGFDIEIVGSL